ncbi:hypothetical protein A0H81_12049 [Grifola frondosa]|uniref:Uncharacterized protein n=1 Tax=Grifola frondosa TaxID=5627 RepID=A0A1C7LUV4_GRIFR|nr:hypothetical protein A0H81_12049 [Grifola frondosa]
MRGFGRGPRVPADAGDRGHLAAEADAFDHDPLQGVGSGGARDGGCQVLAAGQVCTGTEHYNDSERDGEAVRVDRHGGEHTDHVNHTP